MEIYTFDKSLQERLVEYTAILSSRGEIVPASQIKAEWSYHVELVIEPVGWRALWKIPKLTCQEFEIRYPTVVIVDVEQVDFSELSALVKIIAVQDEIHLPEKYDVSLTELYPTHNQEITSLDMVGTASCVDQLRFFFNYLWMPWDADDDDNMDWVALHLESRIRLFFDMKRGSICDETCDVIRTLMREGREIQAKITTLEADISDEDDENERVLDEGKTCQLMKLHFRLQQIRTEMEVLENPAMRDMLARNREPDATNTELKRRESRGKRPEGYFVWLGGSIEETLESLTKVRTFLSPDTFLKTINCLQDALYTSDTNDIVLIGDGEHLIRGAGGLEEGGTMKGLCSTQHTILIPRETECGPSLLDFSGGEVILENISVDLGELRAGILVRKGIVRISDCRIFSSNSSVIKLGIVVLSNAKLIAEKTTFIGLGSAIVVHANGYASLSECNFQNCTDGIQLHDDSSVSITDCALSNFKEYGIRMETKKYINGLEHSTGGLNILDNISEVSLNNCKFENNGKGDVALRPSANIALAIKQELTSSLAS
ncbi:protein nessun dorma [Cephus cinctus]|uniref:Protein nessun dorma n=1 Tax=Cephus cinctus TaxID=211228 RepID=A0AAJ7BR83_CEPCN|nr:protein nessun dorma [Cephus cinctus]XP_015592363.1 protein nessun dorma [Cephus cinctus]XP_015592364.1 protein nessun dorma [Cephus cinctus]XP_024939413.1 protein nessun dorma [Cephus cinctus]XP_024939414.1 protein nessun dorma [Cephus cinctus]XP_024939415.1 protein nessun dorma [Cephus cinctus]